MFWEDRLNPITMLEKEKIHYSKAKGATQAPLRMLDVRLYAHNHEHLNCHLNPFEKENSRSGSYKETFKK